MPTGSDSEIVGAHGEELVHPVELPVFVPKIDLLAARVVLGRIRDAVHVVAAKLDLVFAAIEADRGGPPERDVRSCCLPGP
jgi:hypothetical protein